MWTPLLYERPSWPEVRHAATEERVCLIPDSARVVAELRAVAECVEFVRELLARPLPERLEPRETLP